MLTRTHQAIETDRALARLSAAAPHPHGHGKLAGDEATLLPSSKRRHDTTTRDGAWSRALYSAMCVYWQNINRRMRVLACA